VQQKSCAQDASESSRLMQYGASRDGSIDVDRTSRDFERSGGPRVRVVEQSVLTAREIERADAVLGGRHDDRTTVGIHGVGRIDVARKRSQAVERQIDLKDLRARECRRDGVIESDDLQHGPARPERRTKRQGDRAPLRGVIIPVAPTDLEIAKRAGSIPGEVTRGGQILPPEYESHVPAVADHVHGLRRNHVRRVSASWPKQSESDGERRDVSHSSPDERALLSRRTVRRLLAVCPASSTAGALHTMSRDDVHHTRPLAPKTRCRARLRRDASFAARCVARNSSRDNSSTSTSARNARRRDGGTEPGLGLDLAQGSAERFADALLRRL
jgi:hypothetical protein